uniref:Cyclin N-terminal domain-containing protein n=2 Tax=Steinernema glaseri TaxID=37863 RepID=A0A1I7YD28_9BILA
MHRRISERASNIPVAEGGLKRSLSLRRMREPLSARKLELEPKIARRHSQSSQDQIAKNVVGALLPHNDFGLDQYCEDMFTYSRRLEEKVMSFPEDWIRKLTIESRMREILVDWFYQVLNRLQLLPETMNLTIHILNVAVQRLHVDKNNLQLVGITCMFVAAKYEELYPPSIEDFVSISGNCFSKEDMRSAEVKILKALKFSLSIPYLINFIRRGSTVLKKQNGTGAARIHSMAKMISEIALIDSTLCHLLPSLSAAVSIYIAMKIQRRPWNNALMMVAMGYDESQLQRVARQFVKPILAWTSPKHRLQALREKYNTAKAGNVATLTVDQRDALCELAL